MLSYNCLNERGKKITVRKSGPSNLLVHRTKSMVKLITFCIVICSKKWVFNYQCLSQERLVTI